MSKFPNSQNSNKLYSTRIQKISNYSNLSIDLAEAANLIKNNEVVAFPTETVYGLGANALSEEAVNKIFQAKGRPSDNPIIVHISNIEMFKNVTSPDLSQELVTKLQKRFWPGPLTLIVPKSEKIPYVTTGGLETIAVRMPIHPIALGLIKESGLPIAAPSANISGSPSPTTAQDVFDDMHDRIPLIIDGGQSEIGLESTVLDISDPLRTPMILRPGKITRSEIESCLGIPIDIFDVSKIQKDHSKVQVKSPGMKYRHYAPKAEVELVSDLKDLFASIEASRDHFSKIGIILEKQYVSKFKAQLKGENNIVFYSYSSLNEFGTNLYFKLREMDKMNVSLIIIQFNQVSGFGEAIFNRIFKASSKK